MERGILGVLVLINMSIIVYLYKRLEKLRDEIQELLKEHSRQIKDLQDDKIKMQKDYLDTLLRIKDEVTDVTVRITHTMEALVAQLPK